MESGTFEPFSLACPAIQSILYSAHVNIQHTRLSQSYRLCPSLRLTAGLPFDIKQLVLDLISCAVSRCLSVASCCCCFCNNVSLNMRLLGVCFVVGRSRCLSLVVAAVVVVIALRLFLSFPILFGSVVIALARVRIVWLPYSALSVPLNISFACSLALSLSLFLSLTHAHNNKHLHQLSLYASDSVQARSFGQVNKPSE